MKTNVTVRIDADLACEAKTLAARRGTSLSRLLAEELEQLVQRDQTHAKAMNRAIKDMENAPALGFRKPDSRDELYKR